MIPIITYYRSQKRYMKKFAGTVWSLKTSPHARFLLTACHPNEPKTKTSLTTSTPGMTFSRLLERGRWTFSVRAEVLVSTPLVGLFLSICGGTSSFYWPLGHNFLAQLGGVFLGNGNPTPRNGLEILVGETSWSRWAQRKVGVGCFKCVAFSICFHQPSNSQLSNEKKSGCLGFIGDYTTQLWGELQ